MNVFMSLQQTLDCHGHNPCSDLFIFCSCIKRKKINRPGIILKNIFLKNISHNFLWNVCEAKDLNCMQSSYKLLPSVPAWWWHHPQFAVPRSVYYKCTKHKSTCVKQIFFLKPYTIVCQNPDKTRQKRTTALNNTSSQEFIAITHLDHHGNCCHGMPCWKR